MGQHARRARAQGHLTSWIYLFTVDPRLARRAVRVGVAGLIVDWERTGKHRRQQNADTEINAHTQSDLRRLRSTTRAPIVCRVNAFGPGSPEELDEAIACGADELLLPMVRTTEEVEATLDLVAGRARLGILVETGDAVAAARELARLPLSRVYLGLNDLAIERGSPTIFTALVDGTAETVRRAFDIPFGLAGLTDPDAGAPLPCRLLISELARLDCAFTFLRRSFHRDLVGPRLEGGLGRLHRSIAGARRRGRHEIERDRVELVARVTALSGADEAHAVAAHG